MNENELQILIEGIFSRIKEKYGYTDEQALIYLQGYQDCAEENQQSVEKRDKMPRDTVAELCEAKRLLKIAVEDMRWVDENTHNADGTCIMRKHEGCDDCPLDSGLLCKWKHADEALKLIGGSENG